MYNSNNARLTRPHAAPLTVPLPGSELARHLDVRRRAGLADPDWTLTIAERVHYLELVTAIRTALDDPSVGANKYGARTERAAEKARLLHGAGLHPCDRKALTAELHRLVTVLYGEQEPARLTDGFSLIDPHTRLFTQHRVIVASACLAVSTVLPVVLNSIIALVCVLALVGTLFGTATYRVTRDARRLTSGRLIPEGGEVVTIAPDAESYPLASALANDTAALLADPQTLSDDARADLLAGRDRIISELVELDSRTARLADIESGIEESDNAAHARLVREVQYRRQHLALEARDIAARAADTRAALEANNRAQRQARIRSELDALAAPPAGLLQDPDWRDSDQDSAGS